MSAAAVVSFRHALATLAYRAGNTLRGAPADFAGFSGAGKTPLALVAHLGDLLEWTLSIVQNKEAWQDRAVGNWQTETDRFYSVLQVLDDYLAAAEIAPDLADKLFQGPIADALTHVGQLAMLRRLAGAPIKGENFFAAQVAVGCVGREQAAPVREF